MTRTFDVSHDAYYMSLAKQVEIGADCKGSKIGAVVVLDNRVVSTGYNGTPDGFTNCLDGGCVRCNDSQLNKDGNPELMTDPGHTSGKALDMCICVHAEQNSFLSAARTGVVLQGGTLYTTISPCFSCLKESLQIGIQRIVYLDNYHPYKNLSLETQYQDLTKHLSDGDENSNCFVKFVGKLENWSYEETKL